MQFPHSRTTARLLASEFEGRQNSSSYLPTVILGFFLFSMEKSLSFLVAYCMTDPPRRGKPWGAVEGPAWRGLFAEESTKCQKSARISRNCMRVLGLLRQQAA